MDGDELRHLLEAHAAVLREAGFDVNPLEMRRRRRPPGPRHRSELGES